MKVLLATIVVALFAIQMSAASSTPVFVQHIGAVLTPTLTWEQQNVQEPSVAFNPSTHTFQMWYTGADEAKCMVGYATSQDGITWTKPLDHPVLGWGNGGVAHNACHSDVQRLNGRYYAWFSIDTSDYSFTDAKNGDLFEATSPDGITWTPTGKAVIHADKSGWNTFTANSFVVRTDGHWLMYWESFGQGQWRMSTATSTDLLHWNAQDTPSIAGVGFGGTAGGPWITHTAAGWTMYFHAPPPVQVPGHDLYSQIYEATSTDLKHWTTNPVPLVTQEQPSWQVDQIADPSAVVVNGVTYLYFDGLDNSWPIKASIGVAILNPEAQ